MTKKRTKLFYLHVGKTAGTSLNKYISTHFGQDESKTHIENDPLWASEHKQSYLSKSFISGHVSLARFLSTYPESEYYKFATFRKPIDHVMSHLAWVRHLNDPGQEAFQADHPGWIQDISRKLTLIDFSNPEHIDDFVKHLSPLEAALFDNSQTRYLISIPGKQMVDRANMRKALKNFEQLDLAGITELYNESVALLSHDMGWTLPLCAERLNVASTKYGLDSTRPEIREALQPLIWFDNHIYRRAKDNLLCRLTDLLIPRLPDSNERMPQDEILSLIRGHLDMATSKLLAGWAMVVDNPSADLHLKVTINNKHTYFVKADKYRTDIKEKGLHPTGQCGFSLRFPPELYPKQGDTVRVCVMGLNKNLAGSPRKISE